MNEYECSRLGKILEIRRLKNKRKRGKAGEYTR
jgi:hypothetical protein